MYKRQALKSYDKSQFVKDVTAGIIVAIIALPLSIALALASGVGLSLITHLDVYKRQPYESEFVIPGYEDLIAGIVRWPMSVIRLRGTDTERITLAADHILTAVSYTHLWSYGSSCS